MDIRSNEYRLSLIDNGTLHGDENTTCEYDKTSIKLDLKVHQLNALYHMVNLESNNIELDDSTTLNTSIGIYGDDVGSGKSITLLTLTSIHKDIKDLEKHTVFTSNIHLFRKQKSNIKQTTLIIVPHSIIKQWETYITEYTNLKYYKLYNKKTYDTYKYDNYDVILIANTYYNTFVQRYYDVTWLRVIFDEADSINIPLCEKPRTLFVWLVTSSLQNILFSNGYYYTRSETRFSRTLNREVFVNMRNYVNGLRRNGFIKDICKGIDHKDANDILKHIIVKNNSQFIKSSFEIPNYTTHIIECQSPSYMNILNGSVSRDILSRLNAGDKTGAIELLGCSTETEDNIVSVVTTTLQNKLLNLKNEHNYLRSLVLNTQVERETNTRRLKNCESSITSIQTRISEIENKLKLYKSETCPICMDTLQDPILCTKCCQNLFCMECLTSSLQRNNKCPMCRHELDNKHMYALCNEKTSAPKRKVLPKKIDALMNLIHDTSKKFLIFSSYDQTFCYVEQMLKSKNIKYGKILGNSNVINNNLSKYKNGDINILLLNSQHYGSGINLECTTDLIFYHKMTKDLENQVIGRAQRYGRSSSLQVHFLYYDNELKD